MHYSPFSVRMWCHCLSHIFPFPIPHHFSQNLFKEGQNKSFQKPTRKTGRVLYCTLVPLEQGKNTLWWPMKNRLMSGWMVQLKTALSDCHKICETLYSPLLFIGRTRTATFTLETLRLLSSMVPPDLWQMNEWIQVKPVIRSIHLTTKPRIRLNLALFPRIAPEHIILFLHRSFIAWDTSLFR